MILMKRSKKFFGIDNKNLRAYIDFGSNCSLIRFSCAKDLVLPKINSDLPVLKGFGNFHVTPLYKTEANVSIDEVNSNVFLYVVDDSYLSKPLLIGQNYTELPHITVVKTSTMLNFLNSPLVEADQSSIKLVTSTKIVLTGVHLVPIVDTQNYNGDFLCRATTEKFAW